MQGLEAGDAQVIEGAQLEAGFIAVAHQHAGHVRVGQHPAVLVHHRDFGTGHQAEFADLVTQIGKRHIQADHGATVLAGLAQRNPDLLRREEHVGSGENLGLLFGRLRIPGPGPGVEAVVRAYRRSEQTDRKSVV